MSNIIGPSISLLPIEDIASELRSNKPNRRFITSDDKASDVEKVEGVEAKNIAVAASPDDRNTVQNALKLNGIPAEEFLSLNEGKKIIGVTSNISNLFGTEIVNSRDEVYQTINSLSKKGFIEDINLYEGYYDSFKKSNIKYEDRICGIATSIPGTVSELFISDISKKRYFEKNKYFSIKDESSGAEVIVQSIDVTDDGRVSFHPSVNNLLSIADNVGLYKTVGEYNNGTFSFSEIKDNVPDTLREKYTTQNDDTRTTFQSITQPNAGYAVLFKVPNSSKGAITKFSVVAKAEGNPGVLLCHILKKEAVSDSNGNINVKIANIENAKEKGLWIATSKPVSPSEAIKESSIYFDFYDNGTQSYPTLEGDRYCFVIECLSATPLDNWKIRFSYFANAFDMQEDMHRYNKSLYYSRKNTLDENDLSFSQPNNLDALDMIYTLVTREIIDKDEIGKQSGIYTANILLPQPILATKVRSTLRINKEGCYTLDTFDRQNVITIKSKVSGHSASDNRFKPGDTIVIGNMIRKVLRSYGNTIELDGNLNLDERMLSYYTFMKYNPDNNSYEKTSEVPVYRMNYNIYIKPSFIDWNNWDEESKQYITNDIADVTKLDFKFIIPDNKKINRISDRLIFETTFGEKENNTPLIANNFELQVHWTSPFSQPEINDFKDINDNKFKELIGRIHDIIISFNNEY